MNSNYKQNEFNLKKLIKKNIEPTKLNTEIKTIIYYTGPKLKNIVI